MYNQRNLYRYALRLPLILAFAGSLVATSEHRGQVRFGEVPVPGASVQATQGGKKIQVMTDAEGRYVLADLDLSGRGKWTIEVRMPGFETERREVTVDAAAARWDLKMLPLNRIQGDSSTGFPAVSPDTAGPALQTAPPPAEAADRLLINGSVINGAATPFALQRAFGNVRAPQSPYRGNVFISGNSASFDARSFSLTGQNTPKPGYSRLQGSFTIGGPLQIPHVFRRGQFTVTYSRTQNRNASVQTAQMPAAAERAGDFSFGSTAPVDPLTGTPFPNNVIPGNRISPQARALVNLYPLPNFSGSGRYNYQVPVVGVKLGFEGSRESR